MAWTERYTTTTGAGAHDGTSEANAWTLAEAITNVAAGHRVNVKANATYASTTTTRAFATSGSTTAPIWWRGYTTTIGDGGKAVWTFTSGVITINGSYQIFSDLDISGSAPGTRLIGGSGAYLYFDRVRAECTENSGTSYVMRLTGNGIQISRSWLKANAGINYVLIVEERAQILGTVFRGGVNGAYLGDSGALSIMVDDCVFDGQSNDAIQMNNNLSAYLHIKGCTFYNAGRDGIRFATVFATGLIADCIFDSCGGYGINNASGANTATVWRSNNDFRNNTSGKENGFGDMPSTAEQTESSSPFTNAAGHDFSLVSGANAVSNGCPGLFENESYTSYRSIGAVEIVRSSGSGSGQAVAIFGG